MADTTLFIASGSGALDSRFSEMLDMLLTGAAFGQSTALWLTHECLHALAVAPGHDNLDNLASFGVRCVAHDGDLQQAPTPPVSVEAMSQPSLLALKDSCKQLLVF